MSKEHLKNVWEFLKTAWADCADYMTGRMSAPFLVIGFVIAALSWKYDLTWLLILCAGMFSSYKQVERANNKAIAAEKRVTDLENVIEKQNIAKNTYEEMQVFYEDGKIIREKLYEFSKTRTLGDLHHIKEVIGESEYWTSSFVHKLGSFLSSMEIHEFSNVLTYQEDELEKAKDFMDQKLRYLHALISKYMEMGGF